MKTKIKLSLIFAAIILFGLSGCGRGGQTMASKDYVYRVEELPGTKELEYGTNMLTAGDKLYLWGTVWDENWVNSKIVMIQIDEAGNNLARAEYNLPQNSYLNTITGSSDGRLFGLTVVYPTYDEGSSDDGFDVMPLPIEPRAVVETTDTGETTDEEDEEGDVRKQLPEERTAETAPEDDEESDIEVNIAPEADAGIYTEDMPWVEKYYLVELLPDGSIKELALINDNKLLNTQEYFYANQVFGLSSGILVVTSMDKFAKYDTSGNFLGLIDMEANTDGKGWGFNFINLKDGRIIYYSYIDTGIRFQEFDPMTATLGNEYELENDGHYYYFTIHIGAGYDLYLSDDKDLYGYNLGGELVKLMNYVDSDLFIQNFYNIFALNAESFLAMLYDNGEERQYLARFTKVPPEEVADKIELVLGGSYVDWNVRGRVVKFNKSNEKYRISLIDYGSTYNTNDDWTAGITRLNTDIVSGRAPDIMMVTYDLPVKSYMAKGLFADILPFIEKDAELEVDDLMPNVVTAYSMNGKMLQLVPSFSIMTAYAKTSIVGPEPGWTLNEAKAILAKQSAGATLFDTFTTRSSLLNTAMNYGGNQFIDWETGECHFDSEGFISLLELIKEYPEEVDYSIYERSDFWSEYESAYRLDRTLVMINSIYNLRNYNYVRHGQFGAEITPIGFPTESGIGAVIQSDISFAMSSKSRNQEGAWEFLRYFLTPEYQEGPNRWALPISRKAFDIEAQKVMEKPFWLDENGQKVEYDDTYYIDGQEITIEPMTQAQKDSLLNYILTVNTIGEYNEALLNIINEETGPYFAGQKTVQEIVGIIQSRVQIYVNEHR